MFPVRADYCGYDSSRFLNVFRELIFPGTCLLCGAFLQKRKKPGFLSHEPGFWVCSACLEKEDFLGFEEPYCLLCGHGFAMGDSHVCEECLRHPPVIEKVRSAFWYQGLAGKLIPLYKYRHKLCLTPMFSHALFTAYCEHFLFPEPDLIIPVPLHWTRLFSRKYNQAYLMIRDLPREYYRRFGKPLQAVIDVSSVKRVRATGFQAGSDKQTREKNMKKAFALVPGAEKKIRGKRILLVDDVYTSGATCLELAGLFHGKGAQSVEVLTLARA